MIKKIIITILLFTLFTMNVALSYDWTFIDTQISAKVVDTKWEVVKNQMIRLKTKFFKIEVFTDNDWILTSKFKIPASIDKDKWEYYFAIWTEYSTWVSLTNITSWLIFVYDRNEWRITNFKWAENHEWTIRQAIKPTEEYYVPTWSWFTKFSILILIMFLSLFWIYLRWQ